MANDGVAIPEIGETPGYYLIEAAEYWGALSSNGLDAAQCRAIAEIEGFDLDDAKELRILSLAMADGHARGLDPLGIAPQFEETQHG